VRGTQDPVPQREFLMAVAKYLVVLAESRIVLSQGLVYAQLVLVSFGGHSVQLGFEDENLQPGVGPRAGYGVEDGLCGLLLAGIG
jgi:hypothetical protein